VRSSQWPARTYRAFTDDDVRDDDNEQRTMSMTALQDWLTFRPVDQSAIIEMVRRPFRAALGSFDAPDQCEDMKLLTPGVERC
jgi:hypothetical protein